MRSIVAPDVVHKSKFNRFHLGVFIWCFFAIAFEGYDIALYGVGLPWMMKDLHFTSLQSGAVGSFTLFGMMLGALFLAPIADRYGRKNIMVISMVLFSLFSLAAGFSPDVKIFAMLRFVSAIGMGALLPNLISMMTEYSPIKNRPIIVALMYCGYSIGGILASLMGMYLISSNEDWRILYFIAAIPLLGLPIFFKMFPESLSYYMERKNKKKIVEILNKVDPNGNYTEKDMFQYKLFDIGVKKTPVAKLFKNKRTFSTICFWIAVFCTLMLVYGLSTWLPKMMQETGFSIRSSLSFNLVLCFGQIIGSMGGGYFAEKVGYRKVLVTMFFIGALTFVALSLTHNMVALYILIGIGGACTVGAMNLANPYITEFYPRDIRTTGMGYTQAIGRMGSILAPTVIALILATGIRPNLAFATFAVPSIIAAIGYLLVQERYSSFDGQLYRSKKVESNKAMSTYPH
jgi:MFS transporter, AAHS family, benzoate transport protein